MSKVICDVCGTSYAETVSQCPICGCARPVDVNAVQGVDDEVVTDNGSYTYVKGGRFSKSNVSKRNKTRHTAQEAPANESRQEKRERLTKERNARSNKGLVIAVLALLLAIVAVVIYIVLRFFAPISSNTPVVNDGGADTTVNTEDVIVDKPCFSVTLSDTKMSFGSEGISILLNVTCAPADTTDEVNFSSDNPAVATVDADGKVTAVAEGQTIIRVTCGSAAAECEVVCAFDAQTDSTEPVTEPPVTTEVATNEDNTTLTFNTAYPNEMSLVKGTTFRLCLQDSNKKAVDAKFTSANDSICTVDDDGNVKGVGSGTTVIRATYDGTTYKCTVHVK